MSDELDKAIQELQNSMASGESADSSSMQEDLMAAAVSQSSDMEKGHGKNLQMILDIPLEVSVELGRNKMLINDLLQLGQGSVIELNKLAGEPMDVLVNGRLVARGEVVVLHDKFGVRLTDIISPSERIQQLAEEA